MSYLKRFAKNIGKKTESEETKCAPKTAKITPAVIVKNLVIVKNRQVVDEHADIVKPFLINRMMVDDREFVDHAYMMTKCYNMKPKYVYLFYLYSLPKKSKAYISYGNNKDKQFELEIEAIKHYFKIGDKKAREKYQLLTKSDIAHILKVDNETSLYR